MINYLDISNWRETPNRFVKFWKSDKKNRPKVDSVSPLHVDPIKLYALFQINIATEPNGMYTLLGGGFPVDRPIWWDFVCECEKGFVHVWRTSFILEAMYSVDIPKFSLEDFIKYNIEKYKSQIELKINEYEKHSIYLNHYKSYAECVDYLWDEISSLNLSIPEFKYSHIVNGNEMKVYREKVVNFISNSVKLHVLGKSLILNCAFCAEALVNTLIRIGIKKDLLKYGNILKKHLNSNFTEKLRNLKFYSIIFENDIDINYKKVKNVLELINLRNKYVHSDEKSEHNKIGEVLYDGLYPLIPISKYPPSIDSAIRTYHNPDNELIKWAYNVYKNFDEYLKLLIKLPYKDAIISLLEQDQLGYNENKKVYSSIFNDLSPTFYLYK